MADDRLPQFAWCKMCWDQAAEGTRRDRKNDLPATCANCGSGAVFWI